MKWRFDIMMACGIKDGYQPLIAVRGNLFLVVSEVL